MNEDKILFCETYLKTFDVAEALRISGLDSDVFKCPDVKEYLDKKRQELKELLVTEEDILLRAYKLMNECMKGIPEIGKNGHPTGREIIDTKTAAKVQELLMKSHSMFEAGVIEKSRTQEVTNINISKKDLEKFEKMFNSEY